MPFHYAPGVRCVGEGGPTAALPPFRLSRAHSRTYPAHNPPGPPPAVNWPRTAEPASALPGSVASTPTSDQTPLIAQLVRQPVLGIQCNNQATSAYIVGLQGDFSLELFSALLQQQQCLLAAALHVLSHDQALVGLCVEREVRF